MLGSSLSEVGPRQKRALSPVSPVPVHRLRNAGWFLGAEGSKAAVFRTPQSHTLAQLLKLAALVLAKPPWVNRDCSVVGLERLTPFCRAPLHAVTRSPPLPPICSSVTDDISTRSAPSLSFTCHFPASCFRIPAAYCAIRVCPFFFMPFLCLVSANSMLSHCFNSGRAICRHRGPIHGSP